MRLPPDKTRDDYPFVGGQQDDIWFDYQPYYANVTPPMFHVMQRIGIAAPLFAGLVDETRARASHIIQATSSEQSSHKLLAEMLKSYPHVEVLKHQYILSKPGGDYEIHSAVPSTSTHYFEMDVVLFNTRTNQIIGIEIKSSDKQNSSQFMKQARVFHQEGAKFVLGERTCTSASHTTYMIQ